MYVTQTLGEIETHYRPQPYRGSLVLFYGLGTFDFGPNLGWDGLANQFEHCVIGDGVLDSRRDIMNEPLVGTTARELAPYLAGVSEASLPPALLNAN